MKKRHLLALVLAIFFSASGFSQATLIDLGNGAIYDNVNKLYWYENLSAFTNMSYNEQLDAITSLNDDISGFTSNLWGDWRLATSSDISTLWDIVKTGGDGDIKYDESTMEQFTPTRKDFNSLLGDFDYFQFSGRYENTAGDGYNHALFHHSYENYFALFGNSILNNNEKYSDTGAWVVASASPSSVPEPATLFLLGSGLIGLARFKKRLKRSL